MRDKYFQEHIIPLKDKLYRYAFKFMKDIDEAQDIVQEVYLKLWKQRASLESINNPEAFAVRVTRNQCLDKLKAKRTVYIDDQYDEPEEEVFTIETEQKIKDRFGRVKRAINKLPEQQKEVIELHEFEGFDYDEMAEITGLTVNNIRVLISRARKKIRTLVETEEYGTIEANRGIAGKIL